MSGNSQYHSLAELATLLVTEYSTVSPLWQDRATDCLLFKCNCILYALTKLDSLLSKEEQLVETVNCYFTNRGTP